MRIYEARSEIFAYKNCGKLQASRIPIIRNDMINTPVTVLVATAAGTRLFKLTITNDRVEISIDETSLGSSPDERLLITVNELIACNSGT
jgi:hypothetical protein